MLLPCRFLYSLNRGILLYRGRDRCRPALARSMTAGSRSRFLLVNTGEGTAWERLRRAVLLSLGLWFVRWFMVTAPLAQE